MALETTSFVAGTYLACRGVGAPPLEQAAAWAFAAGLIINSSYTSPARKLCYALGMGAVGTFLAMSDDLVLHNTGVGLVCGAIVNTASAASSIVSLQDRGSANPGSGNAPGVSA